jgi:hypothetical protein
VVLWSAQLLWTWGAWGDVTIDSGHEMYVPALLAGGKTLYRDTWFMYGPAGPYVNTFLFHLFGIHLNVLYWAGALASLGTAVMLFVTGTYLSSWLIGWTAGAAVLLETFAPSLFCFPLPYSFSAVYGCLLGCIFLYVGVRAANSKNLPLMIAAGLLAGVQVLMKPEFGLACYATLACVLLVRWMHSKSLKLLGMDIVGLLPGIALCVLVVRWMIGIGGVDFLVHENLVTWPTSYFMKTFGKMRLEGTGFTLTAAALEEAIWRAVGFGLTLLVVYTIFWWKNQSRYSHMIRLAVILAAFYSAARFLVLSSDPNPVLNTLSLFFFPRDMVIYVGAGAIVLSWKWCKDRLTNKETLSAGFPILLIYSSALAFRILTKMMPTEYSIYYNGPLILSFLLLLRCVVPRQNISPRATFLCESFLCAGCLTMVAIPAMALEQAARSYVPLVTARGTVRIPASKKPAYEAAIQFMRDKAAHGQTTLSVPEDTSLYYLAETECPIRVYSLTPGVIAPGKMMNDTIHEIETKHVNYLLWSNRTFVEYGVPVFGKDFDKELGDYLKSHYRPIGPVAPHESGSLQWSAQIWERIPEQ